MTHHPKVLIVGAGPSGLVLAISLFQNGIPVRIIEKNTTPRVGQRGAGIMPRSLELLTTIGIIDKVLKSGIPAPRVRKYAMPEGVLPIQEFDMHPLRNPTPDCPFPNPLMLGQDRLEKLFRDALWEYGCTVELGTELLSFEQHESHVEARLLVKGSDFDSLSKGVEEISSYEYIIGADGARGVVRKQLGLTFPGETRRVENFVVGDIHVEGLSNKYWHMWGDASTTLVSLRATEEPTLFNFVLAGNGINHAQLANDYEALKQSLIEHTGNRHDLVFGKAPWISAYTPNIRMVDKFRVGRVLLAGDSAHVHSLTGGQGMNTGIQDSFNLGWKLALVLKKISHSSLLDTYTEERQPVVAEMLKQTTKILNSTFKEGDEKPWNRSSSLLQLGVNYRWSSLVVDQRQEIEARREAEEDKFLADYDFELNKDEDIDSYGLYSIFTNRLRAGDRAPDASGLIDRSASCLFPNTCELFRIFGSHYHSVLIFTKLVNPEPVLKLLSVYPPGTVRSVVITPQGRPVSSIVTAAADMVLEDKDAHAHSAYIPGATCGIITIRPDGIIGAILQDRRWLHNYFLGVFGAEKAKSNTSMLSSTPS